ncbi:two-component system phosphate regulon response regulator PhoB [Microbacterium halimionae]|uniref:Two-component system phosphate regulon response regulator PhoB n=1 Tax=Microbacterium halimionae TaxID=1526413 RepID=A0A7W3JPZ9_9MICO|nr:response regulator [Microbacterium halimionae]MBA8816848.1 two-component system phosphate regulon response regulator PhoB [Microbacterium halimionae]NII94856.1 two-component system phosphate regulon response regulator PhoB [Microbacterium halimionae]
MAAILVVEDDVDVAHLLRARLEKSGHGVVMAADGVLGLAAAHAHTPDVIVLDWMMPNKNGIDVCIELRADAEFVRTKILMLSARAAPADREQAFAAGADDYVTKPFSPRALVGRVESLIA